MMRLGLGLVLALLLLLGGCGRPAEAVRFTHPTYGFTVTVPSGFQVNQLKWAPPPPAGSYFSRGDAEQVLSIIRWSEPNRAEEASLLRDGWRQGAISLDGAEGSLYSRPGLQAGGGLWKRAYVQRGEDWFEISLSLTAASQALAGEKAFAALLESWRWKAP